MIFLPLGLSIGIEIWVVIHVLYGADLTITRPGETREWATDPTPGLPEASTRLVPSFMFFLRLGDTRFLRLRDTRFLDGVHFGLGNWILGRYGRDMWAGLVSPCAGQGCAGVSISYTDKKSTKSNALLAGHGGGGWEGVGELT
jgi:hypothetical protein